MTKPRKHILIVGSGSSYNAALCARDFLREVLNVDVKVILGVIVVSILLALLKIL